MSRTVAYGNAQAPEQIADDPAFQQAVRTVVKQELEHLGKNTAPAKAAIEQKIVEELSPLPYVRSVHYIEECDGWVLVVRHDDESPGNALDEVIDKVLSVEKMFGCYLELDLFHTSDDLYDMSESKLIFERRKN